MNTHQCSLPLGAGLLVLLIMFVPAALAQTVTYYDFTFTDTSNSLVSATGSFSFDTSDGLATVGSVTVSGPSGYLNGTLSLAALQNPVGQLTTVRNVAGDDIIFDNLVYPNSNPVFDSVGGLGFVSSTDNNPDYMVNIWGNSPGSYTLAEVGNDGQGRVYVYGDAGTLTLTQIPEPSAYAAMLGLATLGLASLRRFRRRVR